MYINIYLNNYVMKEPTSRIPKKDVFPARGVYGYFISIFNIINIKQTLSTCNH